jgi:hypothetical protein
LSPTPLLSRNSKAMTDTHLFGPLLLQGMLVVDHGLEGDWICYRPSMLKFDSDDLHLEISRTFTVPRPAFLNQPLVCSSQLSRLLRLLRLTLLLVPSSRSRFLRISAFLTGVCMSFRYAPFRSLSWFA